MKELREMAIAVAAGMGGREGIEKAFPDTSTVNVSDPGFKWWEQRPEEETA